MERNRGKQKIKAVAFIDANNIIENSDLTEGSKNQEKEKILLLGNTSALYLLGIRSPQFSRGFSCSASI